MVGSHLLEFQSNVKPRIHTTAADSIDGLSVVEELRAGESSLIFDRVEQTASSLLGKIRKFQDGKKKPNGNTTTTTKTEENTTQREFTRTQQNTHREREKERDTEDEIKDKPPAKHANDGGTEKEQDKEKRKLNNPNIPFVSPNTVKKFQHINDTMHGRPRTIVEMKAMNKDSKYEQQQENQHEEEGEEEENQRELEERRNATNRKKNDT